MRATPPLVVEVRNISKNFGASPALKDVSLGIRPGEVHGLLGQNGSGKSTLIKILAGYHAPDEGELWVRGQPVPLPVRPGSHRELGMSFVHQDLGLVDNLTVLENMRVGRYRAGQGLGRISWRQERRLVRAALARFGIALDVDARVSQLREVERAALAIVRALDGLSNHEEGMLLLDEPTVYLPRDAIDRLFEIIREVVSTGTAVLFVSHQLGEVKQITDRVTVLRSAESIGTVETARVTEDQLIELILGRSLGQLYPEPTTHARDDSVLTVQDLSGGTVANVSLQLRRGEVLGLTGLVGMGYEEIPYLLVGATRPTAGQVITHQQALPATDLTPARARKAGITLVPANRQRDGIVASLSVGSNVSLPIVNDYFRRLLLNHRQERADARATLAAYDVRPPEPTRIASKFSGGNQQKAVLAKWLQTRPQVLVLHEPTQGVDIGARSQIFALIRQAAADGSALLLVTSDFQDVAHLCDRVLVFRNGRVISELFGETLTEDNVAEHSYRRRST